MSDVVELTSLHDKLLFHAKSHKAIHFDGSIDNTKAVCAFIEAHGGKPKVILYDVTCISVKLPHVPFLEENVLLEPQQWVILNDEGELTFWSEAGRKSQFDG